MLTRNICFALFAMMISVEGRGQEGVQDVCSSMFRNLSTILGPKSHHSDALPCQFRNSPSLRSLSSTLLFHFISLSLFLFCVGFGQQIISAAAASSGDLAAIYSEAAVATATTAAFTVHTRHCSRAKKIWGPQGRANIFILKLKKRCLHADI